MGSIIILNLFISVRIESLYNFFIRTCPFWIITFLIINLDGENFSYLYGEKGLIENLQAFIILMTILITFFSRKSLLLNSKKVFIYIKIFLLSILLYEESSFITGNKFEFAKKYNLTSEVNFHNSSILNAFKFSVPLVNEIVYLNTIIISILIIIISFGSFIPYFKRIRLFILDKKYSFLGYIWMLNLILSVFLRNSGLIEKRIIHTEIMELIIYFILLVDTCFKAKSYKLKNK